MNLAVRNKKKGDLFHFVYPKLVRRWFIKKYFV